MKKNKGFTLVELLAAIVLISILALFTTSAITKNVKNSKKDTYETQISFIYDAAKEYGTKNTYNIPSATNTNPEVVSYIKLSDLQKDGYLDKKVINQKTGKELTDKDVVIKITSTYKEQYNKAVTEYEVIIDETEIDSAKKTFIVTYLNINNSDALPNNAEEGSNFTVTLPNDKYGEKPHSISIKVNNLPLVSSSYVYSNQTGVLTIPNVSGNIEIMATDQFYTITYSHIKYSTSLLSSIKKNTKYEEILPGKPPKVDVTMGGTALQTGTDYIYDSASGSLNFKNKVTGNINIYGYYNISFNTNGGNSINSMVIKGGNSATMPSASKSGITFEGWATSKDSTVVQYKAGQTYTISDNLNLYALYKDDTPPTVTITYSDYNTFKWSAIDNAEVVAYQITESSTKPTTWITTGTLDMGVKDIDTKNSKTYYVWAKDQNGNVGSASINNVKLTKTQGTGTVLTLKENNQDGATLDTSYILKGTKVYAEATLNKGYASLSLKVAGTAKASGLVHTINSNTEIASSSSIETYTISYELNGGTNYSGAPTGYSYGTSKTINGTPTKTGHTFKGWCTDSGLTSCSTSQTISATDTGNKTYYAKWEPNTYTITYELNGGTNYSGAPTSYTYGIGATINGVPNKEKFDFVSWCTDSGLTICSTSQTIGTTATGNKTYYAKWKDNEKPTLTITKTDYNTFKWTASDNVGVTGFAIVTSDSTPTSWTTSGTLTSGTYDINAQTPQAYYVWVKDAAGNMNSDSIVSYLISKKADEGTTINVKEKISSTLTDLTWKLTNSSENIYSACVIKDTVLNVSASLQSGWQNLNIYDSFSDRSSGSIVTNNSDITINEPKEFESTATYPYSITYTNITNSSTLLSTINKYQDYSATLPKDSHGEYPYNISITMGGTTLTSSSYDYSNETGKLVIYNITGNLVITGIDQYYDVNYNYISNTQSLPTTIKRNNTLSVTFTTKPSNLYIYMGEDELVSGTDYTYNSSTGALNITKKTTDNIYISAYVTISYVNFESTADLPEMINTGETLNIDFPKDSNDDYPYQLAVVMNGSTLVMGTGFTYSNQTGKFSITNVTGNIVITLTKQLYTLTINPNGGTYNGTTSNTTVTQLFASSYLIDNNPTKAGYVFNGWKLTSGNGEIQYFDNSDELIREYNINSTSATLPSIYNNKSNGTVTHTIISDSTSDTGYSLKIQTNGEATPGAGGFINNTSSQSGAVFYHTFEAKVPTGYTLTIASNARGIGSKEYWITDNVGTGKWETYTYVTYCGYNGTFSSFGHVYLTGSDNKNVTWYLKNSKMIRPATNLSELQDTSIVFTYKKSNATLTAQWSPSGSRVNLNTNGGTIKSGTASYKDLTYTTAYTATKTLPYYISTSDYTISKSGYKFLGWYTAATGGTQVFDSTGKMKASVSPYSDANSKWAYYAGNITLYAQWEQTTFDITYTLNSGTQATSGVPSTYEKGIGATINGVPTRSGYAFNGWCTSENSGCAFTQSISTTDTGNKKYYAKWCQNCASVSNGTCKLTATTAGTCTYTTSCNAGYTINGNGTYNPTCNINSYTLTVNPNGGTWNSKTTNSTITQNYKTNYSVVNNPTKPGYIFNGWTLSGTGTHNIYDSASTVTETKTFNYNASNSTLPSVYNNSGGGTVTIAMASDSTATGSYSLKVTTNGTASPGAGGVLLSAWPTTKSRINVLEVKAKIPTTHSLLLAGIGDMYTGVGSLYTYPDNKGTGDWKTYTFVLYGGDTGVFSSTAYLYVSGSNNTSVSWNINSIVMKSYTRDNFKSVFTFGAGNGTLTANWKASGSQIVFNANGGTYDTTYVKSWTNGYYGASASSAYRFYYYDTAYSTLPSNSTYNWTPDNRVITRTGYTFDGWYTAASGGTKIFNADGTLIKSLSGYSDANGKWIKYDADITVYAHWNANALAFNNQTFSTTFNTNNQTKTYTAATNGTGTYTYAITGTGSSNFTASGTTLTIKANTPAGTYTLTVTATDSNSGVTKAATFTVTVNKAAGAISYGTSSVSKTYGDASFTNTLTKTGDGTVAYSSSNTSVATVNASTGAITIKGAGTSTITATVTDGSNYTYSTKTATYTLTVNKASCSCSISSVPTLKYPGSKTGDVSYSCTGDGTASLTSANTSLFTVSGKTLTALKAGSANVTANMTAGSNYNACTAASKSVSISNSTYTISYSLNSGTQATSGVPTSYTYGTGATINGTPTKTGFNFVGWCTDSGLTNCSMTQTISTTDTGNKTFYAKWVTAAYIKSATYATATYNNAAATVTKFTGLSNTYTVSKDLSSINDYSSLTKDDTIFELKTLTLPDNDYGTLSFTETYSSPTASYTRSSVSGGGTLSFTSDLVVSRRHKNMGSFTGIVSITVDCTSIKYYKKLTADDFAFEVTSVQIPGASTGTLTFTKSYDPATGTLTISRNLITGKGSISVTATVYALIYDKDSLDKLNAQLIGEIPTGTYNPGDEYIIDVNSSNSYHFYVLSSDSSNVNLILNRNMNSTGGYAASSSDNVAWNTSGDNLQGPVTAMNHLHNATKNWSNIKDISINSNYLEKDITPTYQVVDYIESSGTQYIDTLVNPTDTMKVELDMALKSTSGDQKIFGSYAPSSKGVALGVYQNNWRMGASWAGNSIPADLNRHKVTMNNTATWYVDNTSSTTNPITALSNSIIMFGVRYNGNITDRGSIRVYNAKIYDNDVLIRNFVPCYRISDNVIGMYDIITGSFYTNQGSDSFIKGSDIDFETIKTSGTSTKITNNAGTTTATYTNLKARLPRYQELLDAGCTTSISSCPTWLKDYLQVTAHETPGNSIAGIEGYWTSDSRKEFTDRAWYISDYGRLSAAASYPVNLAKFGIRPVISLPKTDFNNKTITYAVKYVGIDNIPSNVTLTPGQTYTATLPDKPSEIIVKMGGTVLTTSSYTYNPTTGELTVPNINSDLEVVFTQPLTITYDGNGGSVTKTTDTKYASASKYDTSPTATKTGFNHNGWTDVKTNFGYAEFDGTVAYSLPRSLMYTNKLSVHFDAYSTNWANVANQRLISCTETGGWNIEPSGNYINYATYDSGVGYKSATSSVAWSSLAAGWHSFDLVFDGTNTKGYLDGNLIATSDNFSSGKIGYNANNLIFIGAEAQNSANMSDGYAFFVGTIKNVVIQNIGTRITVNDITSDTTVTNENNHTIYARWTPYYSEASASYCSYSNSSYNVIPTELSCRKYTTNSASSLSGWTKRTDTTNPTVAYGAWNPSQSACSSYSKTVPCNTDTCSYWSKTVTDYGTCWNTAWQCRYYRYGYSGSTSSWPYSNGSYNVREICILSSELASKGTSSANGQTYYGYNNCSGGLSGSYVISPNNIWYIGGDQAGCKTYNTTSYSCATGSHTEYCKTTRTATYTYYYYQDYLSASCGSDTKLGSSKCKYAYITN